MTVWALVVVWVTIFVLRLFLGEDGALDDGALWALRILSLVIVVRLSVATIRFAKDVIVAAQRGERILTEKRVKAILTAVLVLGLACRVLTWGSGRQGALGWIGAILVCFSAIGLGALYVRHGHSGRRERLSYWHPYFTFLFLGSWIVSVIALGAAQPTGTIGGILVGLFWLSLVALVVQVSGRRLQRHR